MAKITKSITVEVKPTVTLESAGACLLLLNMFLCDNDEWDLVREVDENGSKFKLVRDKPQVSIGD